jgi:hypothetical protein
MTIAPIEPDVANDPVPSAGGGAGRAFLDAVSSAGAAFDRAAESERAFAHGHGSILAMTLDRAQADVVLSVASAAASRAAQAVSTIFNMQV